MGQNDVNKRNPTVEANRLIKTGFEMIEIISELRKENDNFKDLDMRIGVHTGNVTAGFIGQQVCRYDIFGETVLGANKIESIGIPGKLCVSEET
jgi:phospholipid-translocating ATPase